MRKFYDVKLEKDVYLVLLKVVVAWRFYCKDPSKPSFSDVLRLFFKELNKITPPDSLVHTDAICLDYVFDNFKDLL